MRRPLRRSVIPLALAAGLVLGAEPALAANIVVNNVDAQGRGFNDPTPADPVGGNPGRTLGEQRLNVVQAAADIWGAVLESDVTIVVQGINVPLPCAPDAGVLGAAGTIQILADLDPAPPGIIPLTWYHSALYNSITGSDATPGPPDPGFLQPPYNDDIFALFNTELGTPGCLSGSAWYLGLDSNAPAEEIDLLTVVLHELAHGLGFAEFIDETTGEGPLGLPDVFATNVLDTTQRKTWDLMTPAERLASQTNTGHLVWAGPNVADLAPEVLGPRPTVTVFDRSLRVRYEAREAEFGQPLREWRGPVGKVEVVEDGAGDSPTDACEPLERSLWGRIALIDRGGCRFTVKVRNAQDAGALGAIIVNDVPGVPSPVSGRDDSIYIPSVGISRDDGEAIKEALQPAHYHKSCGRWHWWKVQHRVIARLYLDPRFTAGTDPYGYVRLYAPAEVEPGSSRSHWDTAASPNLLMEPFVNHDLRPVDDLDLTPAFFLDIGWSLEP